jgi:(4S)-4-hydroxy-5-phosphonooxypentane-2,3-dione isomerase
MFAVVVTIRVQPIEWEAFLRLMQANAKASLADEPGCHHFDVCQDAQRPNEVFLYELYTDQDAFKAHLQAPHYLSFNDATAPMISEKIVQTYMQVN